LKKVDNYVEFIKLRKDKIKVDENKTDGKKYMRNKMKIECV